ncbi:MAG TPA: glycosyltransferase family 4 protein, partial [Geminicoccaceae bacterium]
LLAELGAARVLYRRDSGRGQGWRRDARLRPTQSHLIARKLAESGPIYPLVAPPSRPQIGFLLPVAAFGGVERVVANYALACRARGYGTHLFVTAYREARLAPPFAEAFDTVAFAGSTMEGRWQGEQTYFGAAPSNWALHGDRRDALGLLAPMDAILNTHATDGHAVMAQLRRLGVRTLAGLHLVERDALDRPMGNPHLALAYEHAYDKLVVISRDLADWCVGQGVPASKLVLAPNAPSYPAGPGAVERALRARAAPKAAGRPLNVLYAGRLDAQKGVDRLASIVRTARLAGLPLAWKVVGKAVLEAGPSLPELEGLLEPPALTPAGLDRLYAWADVVVLPSRFEGVPLVILEAQRFGCVVIATDVGAVGEAVLDGEDGLLVRDTADHLVVAGFVERLARLARDPAGLLATLARGAAVRASGVTWEANLAPFLAALDELVGHPTGSDMESRPC